MRLGLLCFFAISLPAFAAPPLPDLPPATVPDKPVPAPDTKLLAETFKILLRQNMPDPLHEHLIGWGNQKEVVIGVYWEKKGPLRYKPEPMKSLKNDGHWQKVTLQAIDPDKTISLVVSNIRPGEAVGSTLFDAQIGLDTRVTYEQQMWVLAKRLYSGDTRCKLHADLKLTVELTNKFEVPAGTVLPNMTLRLRVTKADLQYRDFVCEHVIGLDGDAAKVTGKVAFELVKKIKPDMEKDLLSKANASIAKAADTKEIRVEFDKLLKGQPPAVSKK